MPQEKGQSLADYLRKRIAEGGGSDGGGRPKEELMIPAAGSIKVRFLSDFEEGLTVKFHNKWMPNTAQSLFDQPCSQYYGTPCLYCGSDGFKTFEVVIWTVYVYEEKVKRLFISKTTKFSALPDLLKIHDTHGTLKSRDIILSKNGKGKDTTYAAMPLDASEFKGHLRNPIAKEQVFTILKQKIRPPKPSTDAGDAGSSDGPPDTLPKPDASDAGSRD
jgi:hypothetical protein